MNVSIGAGLMATDHGPGGAGISAYLRLGFARLPLLLDASVMNAPGGAPIATVVCPGGCRPGTSPYTGPTTALALAPAFQFTEGGPRASLLYRLGPSVSWLPDRAPGSTSVAGGYRVGVSLRLGERNTGLLISGDYYRLLRGETAPQWFLPITIGWQF
ncbi:MAG TPA: hypothetical protein VNX15_11365 [Gemmatimonadales bacterium]|nr:hypothetical protein [Gemmatimonadales bacterium]